MHLLGISMAAKVEGSFSEKGSHNKRKGVVDTIRILDLVIVFSRLGLLTLSHGILYEAISGTLDT